MTSKKRMRRYVSLLLVVAMLFSFISPCFAATTAEGAADSTDADITLNQITKNYVNLDGESIGLPYTTPGEERTAQVIADHEYIGYDEQVNYVYAPEHYKYISGYPDGSVRPEGHLTRGEAVAIFARLYTAREAVPTRIAPYFNESTFDDVETEHWAYEYLETLYNARIVEGDGKQFRLDVPITRAELAVIAARYDNLDYSNYTGVFSDVPSTSWYAPYISAAAKAGWVLGYPDGTFRPGNAINRAEVVTLINRVLNQHVTLDDLPANINPYNDIVSSEWAYCDFMEASILHDTADWHGHAYNDGVYNVIISRYVDGDGKEIAESTSTEGRIERYPRSFLRHNYIGYVTEITHHYTAGVPDQSIKKTADVSTANVGDTVTYKVILTNSEAATKTWKKVTLTDKLSEHLLFAHGSVYIDGQSAKYKMENQELTIEVGDIKVGKSVEVTFSCVIGPDAYGETIYNTAIAEGSNTKEPAEDTDDGVKVNQGIIDPYASKMANVYSASVGSSFVYSVIVGNSADANSPWENVVMTDAIPDGLEFVRGSVYVDGSTANHTYRNGVLTVELGGIQPNESKEVIFEVKVLESAYGRIIENTAIMSSDNADPVEATDSGVAIGEGVVIPSVTKTADRTTVNVGDTIGYTVKLANDKRATAAWENVTVTDTLPAGLSFVRGSLQINGKVSNNYGYANKTLTIDIGNLEPGQTVTVTFEVEVDQSAYGQTVKNVVIASSDNHDDKDDTDDGVKVTDGDVDPSAIKKVSKTTAKVGDTLTYTVTMSNSGFATVDWADAILTDTIATQLTFVHGSVQIDGKTAAYSYKDTVLTVEVGTIAPKETRTVSFDVLVNSTAYDTTVYNTAVLSGKNVDQFPAESDPVIISKGASWGSLQKRVSSDTASVGDTITYTITATNATVAQYNWEDVSIIDTIPDYLTFVEGSVAVGGYTSSYNFTDGVLKVPLGDIAVGQSKTVTFKCTVDQGAQGQFIHNVAIAKSSNNDDLDAPDTGIEIDTGTVKPYATKSASVREAYAGDTITYTLELRNSQDATAPWRNISIADVIPSGFAFVPGSVTINNEYSGYLLSGQALTIRVGELQAGQSAVVKFQVTVQEAAIGQTWHNTATISSSNEGPYTVTDDGIVVPDEVFGGDDKTVSGTKVASKSTANIGDTLTYTITVTNNPENTWTWENVRVVDIIPVSYCWLLEGTIYINGERASSGEYSINEDQLTVNLYDLAPGESARVEFSVKVATNAASNVIYNVATIKGNGDGIEQSVRVSANTRVNDKTGTDLPSETPHTALFYGRETGRWDKIEPINRAEACAVLFRAIDDPTFRGNVVLPSDIGEATISWGGDAIRYFLGWGAISLDEMGNFNPDAPIVLSDFNKLAEFALNYDFGYGNLSGTLTRLYAARALADFQSRSENPETNGYMLPTFIDVDSTDIDYGLIMEMSSSHFHYEGLDGNEHWSGLW